MAFMDIFVGVPQSKYASIAILIALVVVGVAMLFGKDEVPVGQRFLFVLLMFIIALPSVLLSLFQLTCLVTGAGLRNQRWWCAAYAWIGSIILMLYCAIVVVIGIIAMVSGTNIDKELDNAMLLEAMQGEANKQAREYFLAQNAKEPENVPAAPTPPKTMATNEAAKVPETPQQQRQPAVVPPQPPAQAPSQPPAQAPAQAPPQPPTQAFAASTVVPDASVPKTLETFASYHDFGNM